MAKQYYIKERSNPQFKKPYYIACGQLSRTQVKAAESTVYGSNNMLPFKTLEEYEAALKKLVADGFNVSNWSGDLKPHANA
jgi:hypothetical protein